MKFATLGLGLSLVLAACGSSPGIEGEDSDSVPLDYVGEAPVVVGTALEASTGKPVGGVQIEGPGGSKATTDAGGRFVLRGLAVGMEGDLRGTTESGLTGANRLRPLKAGRLEVVLFLR
jgi:hypothetical protein